MPELTLSPSQRSMNSAKGDLFSTGELFLKFKEPSIGGHFSRFERQCNEQSLLQDTFKARLTGYRCRFPDLIWVS
jgi:hypothetical protein